MQLTLQAIDLVRNSNFMIFSAGRFLSIVAASKTPAADAQTVDLSRTFPLDFIVLDELDVLLLRSGELFDGWDPPERRTG